MKKRCLALLLLAVLCLPLLLSACSFVSPVKKLYVYNWGEYMSLEGGDDLHVNHEFEAWYEETYGEFVGKYPTAYYAGCPDTAVKVADLMKKFLNK